MKKLFFILILFSASIATLHAQSYSLKLISESSIGEIPRNKEFVIEEVIRHATVDKSDNILKIQYFASCKYNGATFTIELRDISRNSKVVEPILDKDNFWLSEIIFNKDLLNALNKYGPQTAMRD